MSNNDWLSSRSESEDVRVQIAVLYERLGHVILRLDNMNTKLDNRFTHAADQTAELERRVEKIESQVERARGFMFGVAAAGGFIGGGAAVGLSKFLSG